MKYVLVATFTIDGYDAAARVQKAMEGVLGYKVSATAHTVADQVSTLSWVFDSYREAEAGRVRMEHAFLFAAFSVRERSVGEEGIEDGYILGFTGQRIVVSRPTADMIHPRDIVEACSKTCRWGGMCSTMYVVADHSMRVAELVPTHLKLQALLHDAAEAYLADVPRPVKYSKGVEGYRVMEAAFARAIGIRFDVELETLDPKVSKADDVLLRTEERDLMPNSPGMFPHERLNPTVELLPEPIVPLEWWQARSRFARALEQLIGEEVEVSSSSLPKGSGAGR